MEDYYDKYKDKEAIINEACDCIDANSSTKLQEEISEISKTINSLTIKESWQDCVGDAFSKVVESCNNVFSLLESSISSDFQLSEKTYKNLKIQLEQLKKENESYQKLYQNEPNANSYKKQKNVTVDGVTTTKYEIDYASYNTAHNTWKNNLETLEENCQKLSLEIDKNFKILDEVNSINLLKNKALNLKELKTSINNFGSILGVIGKFILDATNGKYGYVVSGVDGRRHIIYKQSSDEIGWPRDCNRAAACSIASGFIDGDMSAIKFAKTMPDGIGYNSNVTDDFFSKFGLKSSVSLVDDRYDNYKSKIAQTLANGDMIMFDLSEPNVHGESGQEWTSTRHWVAVLDMKKIGDGPNDYAIFVSDSGHGGSSADHGLGEGWYKLSEFDGKRIKYLTTVTLPKDANASSVDTAKTADVMKDASLSQPAQPTGRNFEGTITSAHTVSGTDTEAIVYNVFKEHGYNDAAIAGIMGNLEHESAFNTSALGDNNHSHGICQWNETRSADYRWSKLQDWCKQNGYDPNSARGQAEYAVYEMEKDFQSVSNTLKSVPNTEEGARTAASTFSLGYERPAAKEKEADKRAKSSTKYFDNYSQYDSKVQV